MPEESLATKIPGVISHMGIGLVCVLWLAESVPRLALGFRLNPMSRFRRPLPPLFTNHERPGPEPAETPALNLFQEQQRQLGVHWTNRLTDDQRYKL